MRGRGREGRKEGRDGWNGVLIYDIVCVIVRLCVFKPVCQECASTSDIDIHADKTERQSDKIDKQIDQIK